MGTFAREGAFVSGRSMAHRRVRGFTFIEMMIVFVVVGILTTMTVRAVSGTWVASSRHSAIRDVTAYLFRGRAIAVQQSRTAWVVRSGNILKILVDSSGTPVQLGTQLDFAARYGATLGASPKDTVSFDPRGFATTVTLAPKFIVALGGRTDTVCVTGLGKITTRSCP
jgi:prepilin-type N-terminal cleavage/methylation domain-containing protein